MTTRTLVCCDRLIMGEGIRALLEQHSLKVQVETTVRSAVNAAAEMGPDVLIVVAPLLTMDDSVELTQLARLSRVVLLAKPENTHRAFEALHLGVRAVLSAEISVEELVHVVRTVTEVNVMIVPEEARKGLEQFRREETPNRIPYGLTPRETEVMRLLSRGESNATIAKRLSVSSTTVRSHVHHVLRKLGASTRAQAVAIAYESGLMRTDAR
ncbi:helix-turn-helix transcriptional regulator [Streptomyces naganishii]|uniref:DNA-binding response regulator n=1 Tax=Streptomyces naganishii JCM 4654 TaxID=1306179 RepID=A0A919CVC7_9ACTN|nr:response regulator transcription factor [Streptomyces naganishii]GHD88849.1 DNA-binding response regulator [Streptomyces naganishii JCM 4654]